MTEDEWREFDNKRREERKKKNTPWKVYKKCLACGLNVDVPSELFCNACLHTIDESEI